MVYSVDIRPACATDVEAIYAIIAEVACRIPVKLSTPEHVEPMRKQITDYCLDGHSIVAVDENGVVIGFQLARIKSWHGDPYIDLRYAGVTAVAADKKVFRRMIEIQKGHRMPLLAEVKPDNKSQMAIRLQHYGFRSDVNGPSNCGYRWDPQ
jgi:hypothetical protein